MSFWTLFNVSFRTQYSKIVLPNMKLELSWNWKKTAVLTYRSSPPTSPETYPKGEHNASIQNWRQKFKVAFHLDNFILDTTITSFESLYCQKNQVLLFFSSKSTFPFLYKQKMNWKPVVYKVKLAFTAIFHQLVWLS